MEVVELLVEGGRATGGPPLGPKIGPLGLNIQQVVNEINRQTSGYEGLKVPVKVIVDTKTREFRVEVGTPSTASLIKKELGIEKGGKDGNPVGELSLEQVVRIAKLKFKPKTREQLIAGVKQVIGTCASMGVLVEGLRAKDALKGLSSKLEKLEATQAQPN